MAKILKKKDRVLHIYAGNQLGILRSQNYRVAKQLHICEDITNLRITESEKYLLSKEIKNIQCQIIVSLLFLTYPFIEIR